MVSDMVGRRNASRRRVGTRMLGGAFRAKSDAAKAYRTAAALGAASPIEDLPFPEPRCQEFVASRTPGASTELHDNHHLFQFHSPSIARPPIMPAPIRGEQFLSGASGQNTRNLLRVIILGFIAAAAVSSRLFSVIRFESIIHECRSKAISDSYMRTSADPNSRSVVQFPGHQVSCQAWLLQLLGLVRRP
jgi:hypothetical protein